MFKKQQQTNLYRLWIYLVSFHIYVFFFQMYLQTFPRCFSRSNYSHIGVSSRSPRRTWILSMCSCRPLIKYVTELRITPGFIFSRWHFSFPAHQVAAISDGQHQYRLLNRQFLIVSLCVLEASGALCYSLQRRSPYCKHTESCGGKH